MTIPMFRIHKIALVFCAIWLVFTACDRSITHPPGQQMAPKSPVQRSVTKPVSFIHRGAVITPLAEFELQAIVLSKKRYIWDSMSRHVPYDLVLGWGPMSDQATIDQLDIWQSSRFFFWQARHLPIPRSAINQHCSNMHIIPSDKATKAALKMIKTGSIIDLKGFLVSVTRKDGKNIKSSLRRDDVGPGACEVIWAQDLWLKE